jgi:hypothetical protein
MEELNAGSVTSNILSLEFILLRLLIIWSDPRYIQTITWKHSIYRVINTAGLNP